MDTLSDDEFALALDLAECWAFRSDNRGRASAYQGRIIMAALDQSRCMAALQWLAFQAMKLSVLAHEHGEAPVTSEAEFIEAALAAEVPEEAEPSDDSLAARIRREIAECGPMNWSDWLERGRELFADAPQSLNGEPEPNDTALFDALDNFQHSTREKMVAANADITMKFDDATDNLLIFPEEAHALARTLLAAEAAQADNPQESVD